MKKRTIQFGTYDTARKGWTLTGYKLSDAEQKTNYVEKAGGDGSWDLSTALSDGIPRYKDRSLTVTLMCSEGDRAHREELISELVNLLDGLVHMIVLPDHPSHYVTGRLHVAEDCNTPAYAAVTVTGVCGPWIESQQERVITKTATAEEQRMMLVNNGRRVVLPTLTVSAGGSVYLRTGAPEDAGVTLTEGSYTWAALMLTNGAHELYYSGTGTLTITYREAVLR